MKTLIFVDNPKFALSTANHLISLLPDRVQDWEVFERQHNRQIDMLNVELGSVEFSYFKSTEQVSVHHGLLLPTERQLNEAYFKTKNGNHALVATATLAQGINLPAEVVIIAGDDRFDEDSTSREHLQVHEVLNAAGRAGRAGNAAQGVVILVPGDPITFTDKKQPPEDWVALRKHFFSKNDQCLEINDPMTLFMDSVVNLYSEEDLPYDLNNLLLRLHTHDGSDNAVEKLLKNSFGAYRLSDEQKESFEEKVTKIIQRRENLGLDLLYYDWTEVVSFKTGIEPKIIEDLGISLPNIEDDLGQFSVEDWIEWFLLWFENKPERMAGMFPSSAAFVQFGRALGLKANKFSWQEISASINEVKPILLAYVQGANYMVINEMLPGKNDKFLTKARHFVLRLIPHFSFAIGVISLIVRERFLNNNLDTDAIPYELKYLSTLVREGLNTEEKLRFKNDHKYYLRVKCHKNFEI